MVCHYFNCKNCKCKGIAVSIKIPDCSSSGYHIGRFSFSCYSCFSRGWVVSFSILIFFIH